MLCSRPIAILRCLGHAGHLRAEALFSFLEHLEVFFPFTQKFPNEKFPDLLFKMIVLLSRFIYQRYIFLQCTHLSHLFSMRNEVDPEVPKLPLCDCCALSDRRWGLWCRGGLRDCFMESQLEIGPAHIFYLITPLHSLNQSLEGENLRRIYLMASFCSPSFPRPKKGMAFFLFFMQNSVVNPLNFKAYRKSAWPPVLCGP